MACEKGVPMRNSEWQIIVVSDDDRKWLAIESRLYQEFAGVKVGFVHAPILGNKIITGNGLYDNLKDSARKYSAIVGENIVEHPDAIAEVVSQFESGCPDSAKPLFRRRYNALKCDWCRDYDMSCEVMVGKSRDIFAALERQLG